MKNIIIGVGIIIIIAGAYFLGTKSTVIQNEAPSSPIATTTEISSVPATTTTTTTNKPATKTTTQPSSNNTLKIGQRVLLKGLYVTPSKVTYDSRCPRDVQCVQAGTVELGVILENGSDLQNVIITLGNPFLFEGKTVTLTAVTPSKVSTKTIQESEYRFSIIVK